MRCRVIVVAGLTWLLSASLWAGTMLLDFETEADTGLWHDAGLKTNRSFPVTREARFATSGNHALCLRTPQWKQGMAEWPAVEANPALKDWSGYDRLFFALTNATATEQGLSLFITDSRVATREGLSFHVQLPPHSYLPVEVPLAGLVGKKVNPQDISRLHFYTERPVGDMEVCVDALQLLKPGEAVPRPSTDYLKQFASLQGSHVPLLQQRVAQARETVRKAVVAVPAVATWAEERLVACDRQVEDFANMITRGDEMILCQDELSRRLQAEIATVETRVNLRADFEPVRLQTQTAETTSSDLVVGFASSMEKVLPRSVLPQLQLAASVSLSLARNEKEAVQVVVLPCERAAQQVQVRVSDLRTVDGACFPASGVHASLVGYVETKSVPPYGSSHVGWWPDVILDFMDKTDIQAGDAQSFWVRFRAPKDQAPGVYQGKLEVLSAGKVTYAFDLRVEVYPFTLPDRSPLDLAITFSPGDHPSPETQAQQAEWSKSADYPIHAWQRHRLEWADFLADYYITYDHSFGTDSVIRAMDAFCPLTPSYKRDLADAVREQGKQVWWYICCGPHHPHANMFVEYPAIEGRVLMGAQTAKYRPDGFLYYQISIWNSAKPVTSGPFTDWDPRSWTTYHGDGSWTCVGPDGVPLATIRLENFRDGLEDYAYARLLEQAIQQVETSSQRAARADWLAQARQALEVPENVASSMTAYTHDPEDVYRWRQAMAEALAASGVEVTLSRP
ncbi:MAG: DUF4091 domain-containing protein [Pirellulaceae bacterium]